MKITINQAIAKADSLKNDNRYDTEIKIQWLNNLDMMIADEIIRKHEDGKDFVFKGYDANTPGDTELLVPEPYTDIYVHWLHSKMDLFNQDYERYNSSAAAFYSEYQNYAAHYNREHEPIKQKITVF